MRKLVYLEAISTYLPLHRSYYVFMWNPLTLNTKSGSKIAGFPNSGYWQYSSENCCQTGRRIQGENDQFALQRMYRAHHRLLGSLALDICSSSMRILISTVALVHAI